MFRLDGKVAVITGGSRGLGLAIGREYLRAGAKQVLLVSRQQKACDEAATELNGEKLGEGRAYGLGVDLGSPDGGKKLLEALTSKFGLKKLDILVANAGATWGADLASHSAGSFDKVYNLNVRGVFLTIQALVPLLAAAGKAEDPARVLVSGSIAGILPQTAGGIYGYIASKAAIHHLAKGLAVELGPSFISVNVIAPGFVPTKMSRGLLSKIGEQMASANPLRRLGTEQDISAAALFLVSPGASYVNGACIPIDGGASIGAPNL